MEFAKLPEECIALIISFTTPKDACRVSVVSPTFKSAAESDVVWEKFLPSDWLEIVSSSPSAESLLSLSKRDLFFHLCDHPVLIGNGNRSFALEKKSGKKCYMLGARDLLITWGDTPPYWEWIALPKSRFQEVAELRYVWWLHITGCIKASILSPGTTYAAYLVFEFGEETYGFDTREVNLCVYLEGRGNASTRTLYLYPPEDMPTPFHKRGDGWLEIEMGTFFIEHGVDANLVCNLNEVDNYTTKEGLIVEGIEIRPT